MNLDTILNIMNKHHLDADELLLFYLTFIAQTENGNPERNKAYFRKWYDGGGRERLRTLFESLKEKGVIKKNYNPSEYDCDEIEFNQNFVKSYFKLTGELGQELWAIYPDNIYVNGKVVSLKNITKKFLTLDEAWFFYASSIGHSLEKHKQILELLKWAISEDLIHISIIEFIGSRHWEMLERMKEKGIEGKASTFDIYQQV